MKFIELVVFNRRGGIDMLLVGFRDHSDGLAPQLAPQILPLQASVADPLL